LFIGRIPTFSNLVRRSEQKQQQQKDDSGDEEEEEDERKENDKRRSRRSRFEQENSGFGRGYEDDDGIGFYLFFYHFSISKIKSKTFAI